MAPICCKPLQGTPVMARLPHVMSFSQPRKPNKGQVVLAASEVHLQVPAHIQEKSTGPRSAAGKIGRALVLAPALGLALIGCNRASAAQTSSLPIPEVSTIRSTANKAAAVSYAGASAALSNPKVHASMVASAVGAAAILAVRASQKKKGSVSTPALASVSDMQSTKNIKKRESAPEPGVLVLGLAALMVDSLRSSNAKMSRISAEGLNVEAIVEDIEDSSGVVALPLENIATKKTPTADTPSDKKKFDPLGGVISFAHRPVRFAANRFDFLENVLNGGWQEENQTLENLPRWDPISAVHKAAGEPMSFKINKYDAAESLLRAPTSKIPDWDPVFGILRAVNGSNTTAITKYDPAAAALKGSWQKNDSSLDIAPKWDPIFGIRNAVNDPTPIKSNRYDIAESFLQGSWQEEIGQLESLPKWDPVSGLVNLARNTALVLESKFDVMSSVLSGDWQSGNSGLKDLPSWDPAGKLVEIANKEDDPIISSKYDAAASLLGNGPSKTSDSSKPYGSIARSTVIEDSEALNAARRRQKEVEEKQLPEKTKIDILNSISALIKELESTKAVDTLNI